MFKEALIIQSVNIQENIQLKSLNTMATSAVAKWFTVVQNENELLIALDFCREKKCDYLVLGEGSNSVFVSDLDVLVIANRIGGAGQLRDLFQSTAIRIVRESKDTVDLCVGAGVNWHQFVSESVKKGYFGIEKMALIPGMVGAAPIQNIGAYGSEVKDVLLSVRVYDTAKRCFVELSNGECNFSYRDSVFKQQLGRFIVTHVTLRLSKKFERIALSKTYPALQEVLSHCLKITPQEIFDAVCHVRQSKLPDPKEVPNSGSFFKNPIISQEQNAELLARYPNMVNYPVERGVKLAAGWLIEQAGLKGFISESGVGCFDKQALVVVNPKKVNGKLVLDFAKKIQAEINAKFGVSLEIEPRLYQSLNNKIVCYQG